MAVHAPVPDGKKEVVSFWGWPDEYQSWNWGGHEGKTLSVSVYSTCTSVRLELNGKVLDEKEIIPDSGITATFNVLYEPGELRAVALDSGRAVATKSLVTTGKPSALRLSSDHSAVKTDRNDLSYILIEAIDENGNLVPDAGVKVLLSVSGKGELIGSGNACPYDIESFGRSTIRTFQGRAMAILRPTGKAGNITLKATAEGMDEIVLKIPVKE
jgi:beta-galactosidase